MCDLEPVANRKREIYLISSQKKKKELNTYGDDGHCQEAPCKEF